MLKIIEGNLFDYAEKGSLIAHGCNSQGVMNAGFAKEIRRRFPLAYLEYYDAYKHGGTKVGAYILVYCNNFAIFHAITQLYYGKTGVDYLDYKALESTMKHTAIHSNSYDTPVHLPLIGGGLAGGNQERIMNILTDVFKNTNATLYLKENNGKQLS